jgi:hypothetical protein
MGTVTVAAQGPGNGSANFQVSNLTPSDTEVAHVYDLTVSANVTNTGTARDLQRVNLSIEGQPVATETISLAPNASQTVQLRPHYTDLSPGRYTHAIVTRDDSASGNFTLYSGEREGNRPEQPGDGQVYLGPVGDRPAVFQGEQHIEFVNPRTGGVVDELTSTDGGQRTLEVPVPVDKKVGTYTVNGSSDSPGVVLRSPEVSSIDIVDINGEKVGNVTRGNPALIGVNYNYSVVDSPLTVEFYNDQGVNVTDRVRPVSRNNLTYEQEDELGYEAYDHYVAVEFNTTGSFEVVASAEGDDLEEVDSASRRRTLNVTTVGEQRIELEENAVVQGERIGFSAKNLDGEYTVAVPVDNRSNETAPPSEFADRIFRADTSNYIVGVGNVSTANGNFYYARVSTRFNGNNAGGTIETEFLDSTTVYLYGGALQKVGNESFEEDTTFLNITNNTAVAKVESEDVTVEKVGGSGNSTVSVDASEGMTVADVTVSVNTSVARISDVREGSDVSSGDVAVVFDVVNRTEDSVKIEYTSIAGTGPVQDFELAEVEFTRSGKGDTELSLDTTNFAYLTDGLGSDIVRYLTVAENEGSFTGEVFPNPLPIGGPANRPNPPQNIPPEQGGLDDELVEDLDGDGNPTDVGPTVQLFGELIRGSDLGLTDDQARKLNWNPDSPPTEVTIADTVSLFGEQIRAE